MSHPKLSPFPPLDPDLPPPQGTPWFPEPLVCPKFFPILSTSPILMRTLPPPCSYSLSWIQQSLPLLCDFSVVQDFLLLPCSDPFIQLLPNDHRPLSETPLSISGHSSPLSEIFTVPPNPARPHLKVCLIAAPQIPGGPSTFHFGSHCIKVLPQTPFPKFFLSRSSQEACPAPQIKGTSAEPISGGP